MLFIGLMSGTSLDGVDAVLADCTHAPPKSLAHAYRAFPDELRASLAALCTTGPDEIERSGVAARDLVQLYAAVVDDVLQMAGVARSAVRAIGAHGQTVRHRPQLGFSVQLNAPALLAELSGIDVVADFRSRDIAAGGHGAPLASLFHIAAFSGPLPRAVVNVGGISNLTGLPKAGSDEDVVGFDIGPGNLLLDHWAHKHFAMPFDRDGAIAMSSRADQPLLDALLAEPFFAAAAAKEQRSRALLPHVARARAAESRPRTGDGSSHLDPPHRHCDRTCGEQLVSASKRRRHMRRRRPQRDIASDAGIGVRAARRRCVFSSRCRTRSGRSAGVRVAR